MAVADDGCNLLGLRRLDGAAPLSADVATQKARNAAIRRKEAQVFEEMINNDRTAFVTPLPCRRCSPAALPVLVDGRVASSVGVSGVKPDHDVQVSKAGIDAIG